MSTLHEDPCIFMIISRFILLRMRNVSDKSCTENHNKHFVFNNCSPYRGADKSLARPTSRCILFDVGNILFDASLVIRINSTNIPPIMIISRYEYQNLLSL